MKKPILLLAKERTVGRVKVEYQLFGSALEALDKLPDEYLMQPDAA